MDAAPTFLSLRIFPGLKRPTNRGLITNHPTNYGSNLSPATINKTAILQTSRVRAVNDVSAITSDPAQAEITWQIVIGALAGVTPFVVAGIEFGKRIAEQKNCKVCKGSGLVLRDKKYYFRCPGCGMVGFCHGNLGGDSLLVRP
ncbi:hypothetical protein BUALT_Bualt03G0108000 [Buddleja alternifolia]|uniref:Viral late gene transcription factor 3 zinc ribbon domain-containing protein n=1 Tax=Buddleja alternifolia TaxID=168488 RepID=A0AAV6XUD2_9LAMI|nr:hypothetical protein BUALT_Bualt03G0108000 [Buddleja alternifolia]